MNAPEETMRRREAQLARTVADVDLVVIGGGVNGCAIAWDASMRGMRVALIEKEDFGWATSAWNSRLIHGGLKYLEKYDVRLVRESLREREWLLRAAPHLVEPLRFLLPFYKRNAHSDIALRAGLVAYDALSWDKSTPRHRIVGPSGAHKLVPGLDLDGLNGGGVYYDGQIEYAERLSVEFMLAADALGAAVLNHARARRIITEGGAVTGVEFDDDITGRTHSVSTARVVNAGGPWVDEVLGPLWPSAAPLTGGTKGTHLIVDPFPGAPEGTALYYEAIADGRPMMVIPWLGRYIIGATDVRFEGELDRATADEDELEYILTETNRVFPAADLTRDKVLWSYTGVRPLPFQPDGPTGDITRRHIVHDHGNDDDRRCRGLYSVIGGKLTTARALAEHVVDEVTDRSPLRLRRRSMTWTSVLPGGSTADFDSFADSFRNGGLVPAAVADRLLSIYGSRSVDVLATMQQSPELAEPVEDTDGVTAGEVVHSIRSEHALSLADIVARRIMTGIGGDLGRSSLDRIADIAGRELGWDTTQTVDQVDAYERYITKFNPRDAAIR